MNRPADEAEIRALVQTAERARMAGRHDEFQRVLAQAQARAPEHPAVLNALAVQQLQNGDVLAAHRLIERALEKDAANPSFWFNLATTSRALARDEDEARALDRALALEPRHLPALLQKAALLEQQGKPKAAAKMYQNALQTIRPGAQLPEALRPRIQHAFDAVRANDAALADFLAQALGSARTRHAAERQDRFDHCIDGFLGRRRLFTPQPTFLHFPELPTPEFYRREEFPWLDEIEAATPAIRSEFERVFAEDAGRLEPYIAYPEGVPLDQWAELNHSRKWSVFYLWRDGKPLDEHLARCPTTAAMLAKAPLSDVPGYAPTAFFSILDAKSRIPPHVGVTNTRLIVHLPLVVPPGCGFRVGSETREWRVGQSLIFDDTIEHEAWNESEVPRAVLIFDIWNPYLTAAERELVRTAVQGIRDYYLGEVTLSAGD
jgi:aspartate beta-hydroxylase